MTLFEKGPTLADLMPTVRYTGEGQVPTRGTTGAAAWDVYAAEEVELTSFEPKLVSTGLNIQIPKGMAMLVLPRSGNALKKKLVVANSPGLIDEDYRGELKVILTLFDMPKITQTMGNTVYVHPATLKIEKGDRIAQVMLVKYEPQHWLKVDSLDETARGIGGFGSTGR